MQNFPTGRQGWGLSEGPGGPTGGGELAELGREVFIKSYILYKGTVGISDIW